MALEKIADKVVETDVLVMGGGIGGCPTATKATEHGLKVTLVEKAKTDRSGSAAMGIDHFAGAFPRGMTPAEFLKHWERLGWNRAFYGGGPWSDPTRLYRMYANQFWAIDELEKLGVTMRWDDGELRPIRGHLGRPHMRVHWLNVKPEMAAAVRKRGVNVLERTMIVDLLTHKGAVVGATAVNVRTGEFIVIKAKATVIATGMSTRSFDPDTPSPWKYKFQYHQGPSSGDGWAVGYRAGAELANMEQTGSAFIIRDGKTISFGNLPDNEGIPARVVTWDGEEIPLISNIHGLARGRDELERKGRNPLYYSIEHLPDDFQKRIEVAFVDEKMVAFKFAEERGFNPRSHWYEMVPNRSAGFGVRVGLDADADFKCSTKGLYAVGDCVSGCHDVANAATSGLLVGDTIDTFVSEAGEPIVDEAQVESQKQIALAPLSVKDGTEPMELECAIRYISDQYVGLFRSEGKIREGMRRLGTLRRVFLPKLMAKNPHYLMRALECRNLMNLAEAHMLACLERKETRGDFIRFDYLEKDPSLDDMLLYQRMEDGKAVFEMRKVKPLNMELREGR